MKKISIVHYIGSEWDSKFIIAVTKCGISWDEASDSSSNVKYVTCKKCLKKINNAQV